MIQGVSLTWTAPPVFTATAVQFLSIDTSGCIRSCSNASSPVQCAVLDYRAALTSVGTLDMDGLADLTSTFMFTARAELNGTVVNCSADTASNPLTASQVLNGEFWLLNEK